MEAAEGVETQRPESRGPDIARSVRIANSGRDSKRAMLLTALYIAQEQHGWLSPQAIERVADRLGLTPGQVYAIASFYTLFKLHPHGRYRIQVCEGLSCYLVGGAEPILDHVSRHLGHQAGRNRGRRPLHAGSRRVPGRLQHSPSVPRE